MVLPSSSRVDSFSRDSAEHHDEPQSLPLFDIPFSTSRSQSNHGSRTSTSYLVSAGPIPNNYELPPPFSSSIHPPRINDEQVLSSRVQRAGVPITPFHTPGSLQHTGGLLTIPNPRSPPIPRLRPASWVSPSQVDEAFESHRLTRSRSSANLRGDPSGEEDLPFGRRTLPPLLASYDPWSFSLNTTPNTNSTSSRDHSPDSEDPSMTNSVSSASFPDNYRDGKYR
ncbi:hypothetical protein BDM02DRAFT_3187568 [Thelephora ganbajun]|uniref:Uncharacterized protein n=1 Tax=Thelephora ganbajun TaxID=370292 RepID=A0ACB6ZDP8_THEGA|nr:hypothetical protein BDM02DRAFT_3187568 [Thelephora ganbajun]